MGKQNPRKQRCTAAAKSTGERCKSWAVAGYNVCRMHGAGSPEHGRPGGRPPETGLYSKYLPAGLAARVDDGATDARVLEVKNHMFLLYARITEVIERLNTSETTSAWTSVRQGYQMVMDGMREADPQKLRDGVDRVGQAIKSEGLEYQTWEEVRSLIDDHRKLAEEHRRSKELAQRIVTEAELRAHFAWVRTLIFEYVTNPAERASLAAKLRSFDAAPVQPLN